MSKKIIKKRKKKKLFGKKEIVVIFLAVVLTTLGIKASDSISSDKKTQEAEKGFCPVGMVLVPFSRGDFCIDIYEASTGENCSNVDPASQTDSRNNLDEPGCSPVSLLGRLPWRNISQDQASRACAKAGKRLPSNEEWLQASLGTPDLNSDWDAYDCHVNNNWAAQPGSTGSGEKCISSYGAYDMVGNVWEWVSGVVQDGMYEDRQLPEAGFIDGTDGRGMPGETNANVPNPDYNNDYFWLKNKGIRGIVRGGYWDNKSEAGVYSTYVVTPPSAIEQGIGFRCVK